MSIPTIAEAASLIAAKKLSPVELTKACLDRLHATEATLHAFVLPTEERAMADAKAAEAAIMRDGPRGPHARHSDRAEGHRRYRRDRNDMRIEDPGWQRAGEGRGLRREAGRGGHRADGQADDARVRRWRPLVRSAEAARAQSLEPGSFHRRIEQRHRRRRRGRRDLCAASARIPAARSAARRRCAGSRG